MQATAFSSAEVARRLFVYLAVLLAKSRELLAESRSGRANFGALRAPGMPLDHLSHWLIPAVRRLWARGLGCGCTRRPQVLRL